MHLSIDSVQSMTYDCSEETAYDITLVLAAERT